MTDDKIAALERMRKLPTIIVQPGELNRIVTEAETALLNSGFEVFQRGALLVRPVLEEVTASHERTTSVASLTPLNSPYLRKILGQVARWARPSKKDLIEMDPPAQIGNILLAMYGEWRLPRCAGILTTPTLRPDGTILAKPGYDEKTQLFLADPPAVEIPEAPAKEDAIAALRFLSALLFEFPYADKYSRAVHLSAILSAVGRGGFMSAPMHVTRSHESGSGKSYFNDILSGIATGRLCPVIAAGKTEEETEKRLGAALIRGQSVISIDNINGELAGDFLCQAVERPFLYVRPLGRSELFLIEPRSTLFLATGNNLILSGDLTRRALIATLDPAVPDPEDRTFTREPAKDVVAERGKYIAAALTILRSYIAAGRPDKPNRLGSFEAWSDTVRGALVWLGEGDPVETLKTARNEDPRRVALRDILHTWKDAAGTGVASERTTAKLIEMAEGKIATSDGEYYDRHFHEYENPELRDALLAVAGYSGRIESKTLGYWLRNNHGKMIDGMRLTNDGKLSRPRWWIDFAG